MNSLGFEKKFNHGLPNTREGALNSDEFQKVNYNFAIPLLLMGWDTSDLIDERVFGRLVFSCDEVFEGICLINLNKIFSIDDYFIFLGVRFDG